MSKQQRKSTDRAILITCLLICLLTLPLFFEGIFSRVFSFGDGDSGSLIGSVLEPRNDIRIKSKNSLSWTNLKTKKTDLRLGNSVFSGAGSETTIKLENGLTINMKENSLIKFTKVGDLMVPEIGYGSFELSSQAGVQIMKDGKLYTVQNTSMGSIRLVADQNGFRAFDASNAEIDLTNGLITSTAKMPVGSTPSPIKATDLIPADQTVDFEARLDDIYQTNDDGTYARKFGHDLERPLHFSWQTGAHAMKQRLEHADNSQMRDARGFETQSQNEILVDRLFLGTNYWRVMPDQASWSEVRRFEVVLKYFDSHLRLLSPQRSPLVARPPNRLSLIVSGAPNPEVAGILVEVERDNEGPESVRAFLFEPGQAIQVPLDSTGLYRLRAREVLKNRLLSSSTNELQFEVLSPRLPEPPEFLGPDRVPLSLSQLTRLEWTNTGTAKQFDVEIHNLTTGERQIKSVHTNNLAFQSDSAGTFNLRVRQRDGYGQRSGWSRMKEIEVMAPIKPPPLAQNIENDFSNRDKLPFPKPSPIFSNDTYDSDQIAAEVSGYAMTSSEQKLVARDVALGSILGLRIRKNFFKQQAGEANLRVQTVGFNDTAHSSLYSADLRYFYRLENNWFESWKWRPFISLGAGAEMFRSTNQQIFAPKYDLMKIGFRVNFPYRRSWTMGGDVFYGQAADSSTKIEISGNFGYFFDHRFSAGLGYRVYFFDAATAASTPMGLPYREAFGEGYSVFRYHF